MTATTPEAAPIAVLLYSDDRTVRQQVRLALGNRVATDLPELDIREIATPRALVKAVEAGGVDLLILDGEAVPLGGMGLTRQLKDEVANCPPVVLLVARQADAWLASWSRAESVAAYPIDPIKLPQVVADAIRAHVVAA